MVDCLAAGRAFVAEERVERRLAAILCADVAGYSRLMGTDEEGTLALLKSDRRELIDPLVAQHPGRVFKTTGDGMLIEFASVVDAVSSATRLGCDRCRDQLDVSRPPQLFRPFALGDGTPGGRVRYSRGDPADRQIRF